MPASGSRIFSGLLGSRIGWVPPRKRSPVNGRAIAARRAAFKPEPAFSICPHSSSMAAKLFPTMQTPLFFLQVGPFTTKTVLAQQGKLFIEWQLKVIHAV